LRIRFAMHPSETSPIDLDAVVAPLIQMRALRVLLNLSGLIIDGRSRPEAETAATRKRSCAALASGHWHRGQCRGSTARAVKN